MTYPYYPCFYPCYPPCCNVYYVPCIICCNPSCPAKETPSLPKKPPKLTNLTTSGPPGDTSNKTNVKRTKDTTKNVKGKGEKKVQGEKAGKSVKTRGGGTGDKKAKVGNIKPVKESKEDKGDKEAKSGPATKSTPADKSGPATKGGPAAKGGPAPKGGPAAKGGPTAKGGPAAKGGPSAKGGPAAKGASAGVIAGGDSAFVKVDKPKAKSAESKQVAVSKEVVAPEESKGGAGDSALAGKTICKCPKSSACKCPSKLQRTRTTFTLQNRGGQSRSPQVCPDKGYRMLLFAGDGLPVTITCKYVPKVKTAPTLFSQNNGLQPGASRVCRCPKCTRNPCEYTRTICGTCGSMKFEPKIPVQTKKIQDCCFRCNFAV